MTRSLTIPIGFDIAAGLEGGYLEHMMSPGGYHISAVGSAIDLAGFRTRFVEAVQAAGVEDVVLLGGSDEEMTRAMKKVMDDMKWRGGTHIGRELPPRLVVIPDAFPAEHRHDVLDLVEQGRDFAITVLAEFESGGVPYMSGTLVNSRTVVYLGPRGGLEARRHTGFPLPQIQADAYVTHSESADIHPAVLL